MADGEDKPMAHRVVFAEGGRIRSGPVDFDEMNREMAEKSFRITRLMVAANLLAGKLATSLPTCSIVFSDKERAEALIEAEKLMKANEERKVVML